MSIIHRGMLGVALTGLLLCTTSWTPAHATDVPADATPGDTSLGRAATLTAQICDTLHAYVVDPASRAADAALASPFAEQTRRQFDQAMRSAMTTVDESVLQPLGQTTSDALSSPAAGRARAFAGSVWDGLVTGVQDYVVDPLNQWMASPAGKGASLDLGNAMGQSVAVAAALVQPAALEDPSDPLEPINRRIFEFNSVLRSQLLHPVTQFYQGEIPSAVQEDAQNFFSNLREPITIVSGLLEGNLDDVGNSGARFGINTTIGIAGIHDPATAYGFPRRTHNLEEALCSYRVPAGPYIVLPLYGPATIRDAVGRLATIAAYFEAMGYAVYIPYRVGDAVAQSTAPRQSGVTADRPLADSYVTQKLSYFAAQDAGCGNLVRNGTEKLSP